MVVLIVVVNVAVGVVFSVVNTNDVIVVIVVVAVISAGAAAAVVSPNTLTWQSLFQTCSRAAVAASPYPNPVYYQTPASIGIGESRAAEHITSTLHFFSSRLGGLLVTSSE